MKERLKVEHLSVSFFTDEGEVQAVREVSFSLNAGEVLAVVGESGCGKSVLCKSIMKLLPENAKIKNGKILVNGEEIAGYGERRMRELRGKLFSMVFQNPMTSLNPTMTVGAQIAEAVRAHQKDMGKEEVEQRVTELMQLVGIEQAEERKKAYPYHFSGGMRQRIVLAIALAGNPDALNDWLLIMARRNYIRGNAADEAAMLTGQTGNIRQILSWFNKNKSKLYFDEAEKTFKVREK